MAKNVAQGYVALSGKRMWGPCKSSPSNILYPQHIPSSFPSKKSTPFPQTQPQPFSKQAPPQRNQITITINNKNQ